MRENGVKEIGNVRDWYPDYPDVPEEVRAEVAALAEDIAADRIEITVDCDGAELQS